MRRMLVPVLLLLLLLLAGNLVLAQTPLPPSPTDSPVPTPTPEEPIELPGSVGEGLTALLRVLSRHGPWAAVGLALLLGLVYFLRKVIEHLAKAGAKGVASRVPKGAGVLWRRLTRRATPQEQAVLKDVCATCERLELKGFVKENITIVSLESVYVPLTAGGGRGRSTPTAEMALLRATEEAGEVPLTDLLAEHPQLVLVGEAGSGKTTFVQYVAYTAAQAYPGGGRGGSDWLPDPRPLPLCLPLHGFGVYLADQKASERESPSPDLLRDYIAHHLRHLDLPEGWVAERLQKGNCLLLLDGLDEVARFEDRRFVAELVTRFASFYDRCRVVVTTRPQGYEGPAQLGGDFERRDINPLRWPDDIRTFLYRWNEEISRRAEGGASLSARGRREAHENAEKLMTRLDQAPGVRELANNPLLLTVMAIVHYNVGTLPERRADLYNAATELLLGWDKRMGREAVAPPPWLDTLSAAQRRLQLEELAFDFQEQRVLERRRNEVLDFLAGCFLAGEGAEARETARTRAEQYLTWVTARTYVLQEIGGLIRFYRKPFQEYLAARRLARQRDLKARVRDILAEDWRDRWWDETLLLAVGRLVSDDPQKTNELLASVQRLPDPPEAPHYNATFIARALADVPEGLLASLWEVRERAVEHLAQAVSAEEAAFKPKARLEAGLALGTLGDPRPGVGVNPETGLPDTLWCAVPAGPFLMGEGEERHANDSITEGYLIGRYPVTNVQYGCFMDAGGYEDPAWWGGEESPAWSWRRGEPRWEWQRTDRPDFWHDPRFNGPSQPVVGVTWYEATAFCRWLTAQLRDAGLPFQIVSGQRFETLSLEAETLTVRLPSEAEWEKAARGTDGREWPWGNEWDEAHANAREGGLGRPSPAGILPGGHSPYGCADMAGNVWEWMAAAEGGGRVLRGGSWSGIREFARCAGRFRCFPFDSFVSLGFRCVSPVP